MNRQVLVIGAGPVGMTMAAELARYRVPVRIVDKNTGRTDKSKALAIWSRTLELLDRAGVSKAMVDAGFKVTRASTLSGNRELVHVTFDGLATPYPFGLMLPQSQTETILEGHLNSLGVQVERQTELLRFSPSADKVTAFLRHADGREETMEIDWLVGCDGAHSTVRHGLGMEFEGSTLPSDWILADIHLSGVPGREDEMKVYWHAEGALPLLPISPGRFRVAADVSDATTTAPRPDPTVEEVQAILDRRGPGGIKASNPIWLTSFRINERKVKDYRAGGVFLAGDSAHIHSPAGGQGMNTGIQDACNLAWKLAIVIHGAAQENTLLDSYSIERREIGRQVLANAGRLTTLAVMRGGVKQAMRNHIAALFFGLPAAREKMAQRMSELSNGYRHSPLTRARKKSAPDPAPGERAPIVDSARLVGAGDSPRFALFAPADARPELVIARHAAVMEPRPRPPLAPGGAWLVRPDGYVAVAARPGDLDEVDGFLTSLGA
jgi:2-polyprenyl-6-methoxyphenol hydroxylase-like FAD-dependent oxidoreductase